MITIVPDAVECPIEGEPEGYASRIEDVRGDSVVVSMPMRRRELVSLPLNSVVWSYFNREGARYCFRAVVKGRAESPFPVLRLTNLGDVRRRERRAHARADVVIEPVQMVVIDGEESGAVDPKTTTVVNISAGGLGLVCRKPLPMGSNVRVVLELPKGFGRLEADAEVVRSGTINLGGVQKWQAGVRFQSTGPKDQDRIASFVLYQQQLLRRRGLL